VWVAHGPEIHAVGRSVAVARASAERRGGPLPGRAGGPSGDGPLESAGIEGENKDGPLFQTGEGRTQKMLGDALTSVRICELVKRLKDAGLALRLSPYSFRVTAITDLLTQGILLRDVRYLAGCAEPRTIGLYDRRQKEVMQKKVTRNIVERISI
jgi:integrase/recombinase XerD